MNEKEKKAELKSLIEEYEICFEESKYEGNIEEYKSLKETYKLLKDILNLIEKQSKQIEELQAINQMQKYRIEVMDERELISRDEVEEIIKTRIKEIQNMYDKLPKNPKEHLHSKTEYLIVICELQSILNEIKGDDNK